MKAKEEVEVDEEDQGHQGNLSRRPRRACGHVRRGRGRKRSRSQERERRPTRQGRGHGRLMPEGNSGQRVADHEEQLQVGCDKPLMTIFLNNQYPSISFAPY